MTKVSEKQVPFRSFPLTLEIQCFSGFYDTQYEDRVVADCRGRLVTDKDGKYGYRAVVPIAYPIPSDVSPSFMLASTLPASSARSNDNRAQWAVSF